MRNFDSMRSRHATTHWRRAFGVCLLLFVLAAPLARAQTAPETVGRIEGEDIAIKGQISLVREGARNTTVLASGSEVTVRSGFARIQLEGHGEIGVCGPAAFSLLKSGSALTLALNHGRVHVRVDAATPLTIYTPSVVATPIAVGEAYRDAVVGLDSSGTLCARAMHGAVRLEHQLAGGSVVVPEGGEVTAPGSQLESIASAAGACGCGALAHNYEPPAPPTPKLAVAALAETQKKEETEKKEETPRPRTEEPAWKVLMPPLTFDASAPPEPLEPREETILLMREVRVSYGTVFSGRVAPRALKTKPREEEAPVVTGSAPGPIPTTSAEKKRGFGARLGGFFRRLFGGKAKSGYRDIKELEHLSGR
jgi:hypothetical protein